MTEEITPAQRAANQNLYNEAARQLQELLDKDEEALNLAYTALMGFRLVHWAAGTLSEIPGVSTPMVEVMINAQDEMARGPFNFEALVKDLQDKRVPWLEDKRKEALIRRRKREKQIKALQQRLRRDDIPLPFHSMRALFGDAGFHHDDMFVVFGPQEAVSLVLRACAKLYQRTGGNAALLLGTDGDAVDESIARISLPANWYRNGANVYNDLLAVLEPIIKPKEEADRTGLVIAESLDELLAFTPIQDVRPTRLGRALVGIRQAQVNHGFGLIIGVATDDDLIPEGENSMLAHYPPNLLHAPHLTVKIAESEIVGGGRNIVIGNDVVPIDKIKKDLAEAEE